MAVAVDPQRSADEPVTVLSALRAFEAAQRRRVAHWKEYDDALDTFLAGAAAQPPSNHAVGADQGEEEGKQDHTTTTTATVNGNSNGSDRTHPHAAASVPVAIDPGVMTQILQLVTRGLLDCSHEVRAIQIELQGSSSSADDFDPSSTAAVGGAGLNRPDLARLIGRIQDLENELLRNTVQRDQARRLASLAAGAGVTSSEADINQERATQIRTAQTDITRIRTEITELMQDVSAEIAELVL